MLGKIIFPQCHHLPGKRPTRHLDETGQPHSKQVWIRGETCDKFHLYTVTLKKAECQAIQDLCDPDMR